MSELAAMANVSCCQVYQSEKFESQNIFSSQYFQKIAEALGGRFEYVLIPDKQPLPRSRSLVPLSSFPDHPSLLMDNHGISMFFNEELRYCGCNDKISGFYAC